MLIGIDLGTSSFKAIAVDDDGVVVAKSTATYPLINLRSGWSEQEPAEWWRATGEAMTALAAQLPEKGKEITGIGLCGQMHGLTAMDADGEVIRPAILWNDQRCAAECDWITEQVGGLDKLVELNGNRMFPGYTGGKIIWLRDHEPENYAKMVRLLNPKDYIRFRMTGLYVTDVSDASGTGLFDVRNRTWSLELLRAIDIDPALLPDVVESTEQTGTLDDDIAAAWGFPAGTPVFGGGGDAVIQTSAMGLIEEGSAGFTVGTAGIVAGGLSRYPDNPAGRVQVSCGNEPGRWHIMGNANSAGGAFQWLRDALRPLNDDEELSFQTLVRLAREVEPGANGVLFLPYLLGERSPNLAPDASAALVGLTQMHDVGHIARAVMEGVLLNMRGIFEICVDAGLQSDQVVASGGVSNDPMWLQLLADILGREVVTQVGASEGGAYGAVLAAGVGTGLWADLTSALTQVKVEKTYVPDDDRHARYETIFGAHRRLHGALTEVYELARTAEGVSA
ncbi:xylulokinase [Georgenia sp. Z1491]|uniref:xylulokinase n=1 Tax=Georgenia sp. Z1491 TaxID=3416707 RepID=UPI003CEF36E2